MKYLAFINKKGKNVLIQLIINKQIKLKRMNNF